MEQLPFSQVFMAQGKKKSLALAIQHSNRGITCITSTLNPLPRTSHMAPPNHEHTK